MERDHFQSHQLTDDCLDGVRRESDILYVLYCGDGWRGAGAGAHKPAQNWLAR